MPAAVAEFMTGLMVSQIHSRKRPYAYLRKSKVILSTPVMKDGKRVIGRDGKPVIAAIS